MSKRIAVLGLMVVFAALGMAFGPAAPVSAPDHAPRLQDATATAEPSGEATLVVTVGVVTATSTAAAFVPVTGNPPLSMSALIIVALLILLGITVIVAGLALSRRPM